MPHIVTSAPPPRPRPPRPRRNRNYGAEHQRLRLQWLRDHPLCQWCGGAFSSELHHADGDSANTDSGNLVALCGRCHDGHHAALKRGRP